MSEAQPAEAAGRAPSEGAGLTLRSGLVALGALALLAYVLPAWMLWMKGPAMPGGNMPLVPFVAALLLLGLRFLPGPLRVRFSGREVLTVFAVLAIGMAAFHVVGNILALLPTPYYYATPENDYRGHFLTELPKHLVPFDPMDTGPIPDTILRFYRGSPPGMGVPWEVWTGPLLWWFGLLGLVFLGQFCLGSLLRRQWLEHEKLMFPHVTMLTSLVGEGRAGEDAPAGGGRLFWTGVGVSGFIFLLEGLNHYAPAVPSLGLTRLSMRDFLVEEPWRSMEPELAVQPYVIAVSYLLTTEITFSIWFFAVVDNLFRALASALTLTYPTKMAWVAYWLNSGADAVGAVAVFIGALLWTARGHLREVLRRAFGRAGPEVDRGEAMGYRAAFWGLVGSVAGVLAWCAAAGFPVWFAALLFGLYGLGVLLVARLVAETGLPSASSSWLWPHIMAIRFVGYGGGETAAAAGGAKPVLLKGLSVISFVWPSLMLGPHLMPMVLTGFKATEASVRRRRWLLRVSFAGLLLAMVIFGWRMLVETYARGALNSELGWFRESIWVFNNVLIRDILLRERSQVTDWTNVGFAVAGAVVMAFLFYMRRAFYWWPIHPIGFVTTGIDNGIWFSVLIGWFIKRTALKYGGGEAFKKMIGFFIGLFVGQFAMAALWYLVGLIAGEVGVHVL